MIETFKWIPGWEGKYKINQFGDVISVIGKEKRLKPWRRGLNYQSVSLCKEGERYVYYIHQLVYMTWVGPLPKDRKWVIDHIDRNVKNNSCDNLRLISQRENCKLNGYNLTGKLKKTSRFVGVRKRGDKWVAKIVVNGKLKQLGTFNDEMVAAKVYDEEKRKLENGL